jgi:hypothetical protein
MATSPETKQPRNTGRRQESASLRHTLRDHVVQHRRHQRRQLTTFGLEGTLDKIWAAICARSPLITEINAEKWKGYRRFVWCGESGSAPRYQRLVTLERCGNASIPQSSARRPLTSTSNASVFGCAVTMTADTIARLASNTGAGLSTNALSVASAPVKSVTARLFQRGGA